MDDSKNDTTWFSYRPLSKSSTYEVLPDQAIKRPKIAKNPSRSGLQLSHWSLEIWSAILSICALAALIAVLIYANGVEVHAWHGITLNTVVSALATISKLAATYVAGSAIAQTKWCLFSDGPQSLNDFEAVDLASRGVSGCFTLLWRARKFGLIGAYALILATIFDPFAQQLVHYQNDVVYASSAGATIVRAQKYSVGNRILVEATSNGIGAVVIADADYLIQAAVPSALVLPLDDIVQQLRFNCASGNCTWPAFESIAICSACNDVHSYLTTNYSDNILEQFVSTQNPGSAISADPIPRPTLPNGLQIDYSVQMTTYGTGNPANTVTMGSVDTLVWSMTILKQKAASSTRDLSDYEAIECALRYCVQQYNSTVINSQIHESAQIVESASRAPNSWKLDSVDRSQINGAAQTSNITVTNAEINDLDFNSSTVSYARTDLMLAGQYNAYNISQTAIDGISSLMYNTFTDTGYEGINGMYMTGGDAEFKDIQYSPPAMQRLWASQNLEESFKTLAVSMSNAIRARSDNNAIETGQEGSSVTKFSISWPWIALPLLVILTSLAQFLVVIFSSRTVPLWKESTLAVLSRGRLVDGLFDQASTVREMRAEAGRTKVNLFEDKTELRNLTPSTFGRIDTEYRS